MSSPHDLPPRAADVPVPAASASRSTRPFILSAIMLVVYLGFILLVAYAKPFLGLTLVPGLSWGMLLGALVIVCAWVLTYVYVASAGKR